MGQHVRIVGVNLLDLFLILITITISLAIVECTPRKYIQIPEPDGLHYYPYQRLRHERGLHSDHPVYVTVSRAELGQDTILLRIKNTGESFTHNKKSDLLLRRNKIRPDLFVYNIVDVTSSDSHQLAGTAAELAPVAKIRKKRSTRLRKAWNDTKEAVANAGAKLFRGGGTGSELGDGPKKVIHLPALFIDVEKDGFEHVFYRDIIVSALCLTNRPDLDRHEIRDEYEAKVCFHKGYAAILPELSNNEAKKRSIKRRKREDGVHYQDHEADKADWHLDKNKYDVLWRNENVSTSSSTKRPADDEIVEDLDYAYEYDEDTNGNGTVGWEEHEVDPHDLDFIVWPAYLPVEEEKVNKSDKWRSTLHEHPDKNLTLTELYVMLQENHSEIEFDRRKFALNESSFLSDYYTSAFHLWTYNYEGLIKNFFLDRERTLNSFYTNTTSKGKGKVTLESIRQLFILYIIDVHHVNCFNRHIRFYGYVMKRPASINGDEITNNGRLTRGIIMRALELLRHVPQYNVYKELFLRLLIASLKERASSVKHSTKLAEENDYTELFEVASYLEYLLQNGIHPDEKNQDLFVQETRFYAHHFMNTLTL